uniref:Ig-like domain-containing protein n=1 Tax=Vespula pensylvanica TaxID=30213 RepID=A0A834JM10_VESPE|nr:hypothetical protein H0235_017831 [Vespula pensylvanica]
MATSRGSDDIVDGSANGDPFSPFPSHHGKGQGKESDPFERGRGGHLEPPYSPTQEGRSRLLHVPNQRAAHVEPAGMRRRPSSGTSEGEVSVLEGENATLSCKASGRPAPRVLWKREKSDFILMRGLHEALVQVDSQSGEKLELTRVDRRQMGAYLCIARNEVPPTVSKRVYLRVNFAPSAKVRNQLLGSPLDTDVSLICSIEAYPKTINLWTRKEQVIMSGGRYEIDERSQPEEEWKTTIELKIKRLQKTDLGEYTCSASSSMGKAAATIRVYEIERATLPTRATSATWKKQNKGGKSKTVLGVSTVNRVFPHLSTPAMQKSTSRLIFGNKYSTTSTTVDPRAGGSSIVVKGNNGGYNDEEKNESKEEPKVENVANIGNFIFNKQIYTICLTFLSTIR